VKSPLHVLVRQVAAAIAEFESAHISDIDTAQLELGMTKLAKASATASAPQHDPS
jgi:hypothetical protein